MKKLLRVSLLILTVSLFISCGDDDNDSLNGFDNWNSSESPNYKPEGYNPIAGEWVKDGSIDPEAQRYTHKYIFSNKFKYQESYYSKELQNWGNYTDLADYIINDKAIRITSKHTGVESHSVYRYKMETDENGKRILYLNSVGDIYVKYLKYK